MTSTRGGHTSTQSTQPLQRSTSIVTVAGCRAIPPRSVTRAPPTAQIRSPAGPARPHAPPAPARSGRRMPARAARRAGRDGLLAMPPLRAIGTLAAPTTVVMLVAAASNALSTWYVSRLGTDAIAAVSLVFPVSLLATTA